MLSIDSISSPSLRTWFARAQSPLHPSGNRMSKWGPVKSGPARHFHKSLSSVYIEGMRSGSKLRIVQSQISQRSALHKYCQQACASLLATDDLSILSEAEWSLRVLTSTAGLPPFAALAAARYLGFLSSKFGHDNTFTPTLIDALASNQ